MPRLRTRAAAAAAQQLTATPAAAANLTTFPSAVTSPSLALRTPGTTNATAHSSTIAHLSQSQSSSTQAVGHHRFGHQHQQHLLIPPTTHMYFNGNQQQQSAARNLPAANGGHTHHHAGATKQSAAASGGAAQHDFPPPDVPSGHALRKRKENVTSDLRQSASQVPGGGDKRVKRLQQHLSTTANTGDSGFAAFTDESHLSTNGGGAHSYAATTTKLHHDSASMSAESTSSAGVRGSLLHASAQPPAPSNRSSKYVGAHISGQGGGLPRIAQIADDIGAKCLCVHVRNQRRWKQPPLSNDAVKKFTERVARSKTLCAGPRLLAKASSLFNLGSPTDEALQKTRDGLQDELQRCRRLGIAYYVVQPGTTQGKCDVPACLERIAATVTEALKTSVVQVDEEEEEEDEQEDRGGSGREEGVQVLFLNMCLQGYTVGGKLQELKSIIDLIEPKQRSRVGMCFDVLAAYAAGYNIATSDGLSKFLDDVDATIGLSRLRAVRLMDSELPVGSHLHRPTTIGHGWIGLEGFKSIMNDPRLNHLPMFIDTNDTAYQRDIETLYSLCRD